MDKILIFTEFFIPAVKGGGPIRSIKNLIDNLGKEVEIYIITSDRDLGDPNPFENIKLNSWTTKSNVYVYYINQRHINIRSIFKIVRGMKFNSIYLNSFFSYKFSILPYLCWKLNLIKSNKAVIAPRGEFSQGALGLKKSKKVNFLKLINLTRLYSKVEWHATNSIEKTEIEKNIQTINKITTINNLTSIDLGKKYSKSIVKIKDELKIAYLSRIHPMKNLKQLLESLEKIKGKVELEIYGPIEDELYWKECNKIIKDLKNVKVNYYGEIANNLVSSVHSNNHIYILLTLGENFGHSIFEALINGSPIIISDRTPWQKLEENNIGRTVKLENPLDIVDAIQYFIDMDDKEYQEMSQSAFEYAQKIANNTKKINNYKEMLI